MRLIAILLCAGLSAPLSAQQTATNAPAAKDTSPSQTTSSPQGTPDDGVIHDMASNITPPRVIHQVDAHFSTAARKAHFSGVVEVDLVVDENGNPTNVHVKKAAGMGLDEEAVKAVCQYKFKPAKRDGKPVKVEVIVAVNFQLVERRGWW